ncbi:set domain-containing protein 5 [Botrytis cinerea]
MQENEDNQVFANGENNYFIENGDEGLLLTSQDLRELRDSGPSLEFPHIHNSIAHLLVRQIPPTISKEEELLALANSHSSWINCAIKTTDDRGLGIFATQRIPVGSLILSEQPTLKVSHMSVDAEELLVKLTELSLDNLREFALLHNAFPQDGLKGVVKTNGFRIPDDRDTLLQCVGEIGMYFQAARINHACLFNGQHTIDNRSDVLTVYATRDIEEGEEITINYSNPFMTREGRQADLKKDYRFECKCELCTKDDTTTKDDDDRAKVVSQILSLEKLNLMPTHSSQDRIQRLKFLQCAIKCCTGLGFKTGNVVGELYGRAMQTTSSRLEAGEVVRAEGLARMACFTQRVCEAVKVVLGDEHEYVVVRREFLTTDDMIAGTKAIPTELSSEELNEWLWNV